MYIEEFLKSPDKRARLTQALSTLNDIGFFSVMLELSHGRAGNMPSSQILEGAAIQRGFSLGYFQCIQDTFNFLETFTPIVDGKRDVRPNWGADSILMSKGFTEKEIQDARHKRFDSRSS